MKQSLSIKTIAFIGHRNIAITNQLEIECYLAIKELILHENASIFLFGSKSAFNDLCLKIVTELQKEYCYLSRIYVRAEYEYISDEYLKYLLEFYDDTIFPTCVKGAGKACYVKRNKYMIDLCNIAVFYYNKNCNLPNRKSGTEIAYKYALNKKKHLLNLFEIEN